MVIVVTVGVFCFKQKTAYEMRISDWSSDVCSSDLPDDAAALDLQDGQWARVSSATGSVELPIVIVAGGRPGVVAIPHGWGSRIFDPKSGTQPRKLGVNRNLLVDRREVDPFSQIPALSAIPVRVEVLLPAHARQASTAMPAVH